MLIFDGPVIFIKKITDPSKINIYENMNNHFHQCIKNVQMEGIFRTYSRILKLKLLEISEMYVAALRNTHKIASCNYLQGRYLYLKKIYLVRGIISFLLYHDIFNLVKRDNFHGIEKLRQSAYRLSLKIFCIKNLLSRNFKNCSSKSTTFFAVCHMYGLLLL